MRILFVGSPKVLPSDMVDHIRDMEAGWEFEFATGGGVEAISAVELQGYDAVIASTDMPDMAPEEMLDEIRHLKPQVIRIALVEGGENARMSSSLMLDAAHRFLPLPLSAETLMDTLGSLEELRDLLGNTWLHAEIGKIEKLPSPPHLYLKLTRALADNSHASAAEIAEIVASDPGIAAKVMQLCNSAFFSFGRSVSDLRSAVTRLGTATLRDLVLASEVFSGNLKHADVAAMQRRALMASRLAAKMLPSTSTEMGATAALLADVGLLLPGMHNERAEDAPSTTERRPGHTQAGAYLLGLWGLPMPIIEAVAFQLTPGRSSTRSFWVPGAVHVATGLVHGSALDEDYLERVHMLPKLPEWQQMAAEIRALARRNNE